MNGCCGGAATPLSRKVVRGGAFRLWRDTPPHREGLTASYRPRYNIIKRLRCYSHQIHSAPGNRLEVHRPILSHLQNI